MIDIKQLQQRLKELPDLDKISKLCDLSHDSDGFSKLSKFDDLLLVATDQKRLTVFGDALSKKMHTDLVESYDNDVYKWLMREKKLTFWILSDNFFATMHDATVLVYKAENQKYAVMYDKFINDGDDVLLLMLMGYSDEAINVDNERLEKARKLIDDNINN